MEKLRGLRNYLILQMIHKLAKLRTGPVQKTILKYVFG